MKRTEAGQSLLIGVLILTALLVAVPAIIFLNQHSAAHAVSSQKRLRGRAIAEEGAAYCVQRFLIGSNPPQWPFLNTVLTPSVALTNFMSFNHFDGVTKYPSSQGGGYFTVECVLGTGTNGLEAYQIKIISRPYDENKILIPGSSIAEVVSQRTLGVKLADGTSAGAALQLGHIPNYIGYPWPSLDVGNGPIVLFDTGTWHIPTTTSNSPPSFTYDKPMNGCQAPRKFSIGGLTSAAPGDTADPTYTTDPGASLLRCPNSTGDPNCLAATDKKEYWAFASLGFPPVIDEQKYINSAESETGIAPGECYAAAGGPPYGPPTTTDDGPLNAVNCQPPGNTTCGYFDPTPGGPGVGCPNAGDLAVFGTTPGSPTSLSQYYTVPNSTSVIYVNGDTVLQNTAIDFKQGGINGGGAFIVNGNVTLNYTDVIALGTWQTATVTDIRMSPTSMLDHPYRPANTWPPIPGNPPPPCVGAACNVYSEYNFFGGSMGLSLRGFLWVKKNLTIPLQTDYWVSGVVRVDGAFYNNISPYGTLFIRYDDEINRKIRTTNLEVQADSVALIPS